MATLIIVCRQTLIAVQRTWHAARTFPVVLFVCRKILNLMPCAGLASSASETGLIARTMIPATKKIKKIQETQPTPKILAKIGT